jgi:hypothetical protein
LERTTAILTLDMTHAIIRAVFHNPTPAQAGVTT